MKRLFHYIPELMLVAGLLSVIGIYFSSTAPLGHACMANVAWGDAELFGKWMQVGSATVEVFCVSDGNLNTRVPCP